MQAKLAVKKRQKSPFHRAVLHFATETRLRNRLVEKERLIEAVLRNRANQIILQRLPELGLPDAWLVSGSVIQTVWNVLTGRAPNYGIKDYDILYFDADTSWEAEDANIRRVAAAVSDISVLVELRNQARVHLWYPNKFLSTFATRHAGH
jgi:uncharacterized protein